MEQRTAVQSIPFGKEEGLCSVRRMPILKIKNNSLSWGFI